MGKVYDSFFKSFHGPIFLPVSSTGFSESISYSVSGIKVKRATRKLWLYCLLGEVLGCSHLEFLKESLDVVRETLCACDHSTSVLKRDRGLSALRDQVVLPGC